RRASSLSSVKQPLRVPTSSRVRAIACHLRVEISETNKTSLQPQTHRSADDEFPRAAGDRGAAEGGRRDETDGAAAVGPREREAERPGAADGRARLLRAA